MAFDSGVTHPAPDSTSQPAKRRMRGGRVALLPELPRVEVIHELPEGTRHCAEDGTELKVIGEDVSEELHVVPARAAAIVELRPWEASDDLTRISGLNPARLAEIQESTLLCE
ncbi:hypothetical protein SAMN05192555_10599 [Franzmannia pantelleriensis]|uniref:Uncharacterized protein n=1 Tax=Franzmannia pantelleriensis TaxID=48727 RepID=A0A1G9KZ46_9GAMM|nr:IS66 family transposase zinc-finger binding domain-containing protein [Halomonas pantelleriensis]SDL55008.1 hypothetical protein SAMN05192555_10599 [Halomonas pantelleriensis]